MKKLLTILPWIFVAIFGAEIVAVFMPKKDGELHLREFARLPVLLSGRIQPFDSAARNSLLQIRSTGDVPLEEVPSWKFWHHPKKLRSTEWLAEVLFKPEVADTRPIFLIHHPELLSELKLTEKGVEKSGLRYYTFKELEPALEEIGDQAGRASQIDDKLRTPVQKQALKLGNALMLYRKLKGTLRPPDSDDFARELAEFTQIMTNGVAAVRAKEAGKPYDAAVFAKFWGPVTRYFAMANEPGAGTSYPLTVPPRGSDDGHTGHDEWTSLGAAVVESIRHEDMHPSIPFFADMASGYRQGDAAQFNRAVAGYRQSLEAKHAKEVRKGQAEFFYNDTKAFLHATIICICAFLLAAIGLLTYGTAPNLSESMRRSAFYLLLMAGSLLTYGLIFRMVLEGRPPVTNLYSSALFIGWGLMVLGIILEILYRVGLGNAVASVGGFVSLMIAHNLGLGGDTMEMMRAVLDTNFWLATHVVTVTIGYSATFASGLLAIAYIVLGIFTPILKEPVTGSPGTKVDIGKALSKMVYGIVCFATFFSFVGTVLGGIWADQSWGRFWGWDPKENGALLIVLWNAAFLHVRWGGLMKERGLMSMAVFGNVVTAWSWFGTNMLGIGLHSYGFMDAAFVWLMIWIASQLSVIALAAVPLKNWASFRTRDSRNSGNPSDMGGGRTKPSPAGA